MRKPIDWSKVSSPLSRMYAEGERKRKLYNLPKWDEETREKFTREHDARERRAKFQIVR